MKGFEQTVYVSYAWGDDREEIVNQIDQALQQRGLTIIRDKRDLPYKGSISEFMERIGQGSCVIIVISDKYLRSPNCMFELVEIAEGKQFHERIFPIVLSDANIYDPVKRLEYVKYWEAKLSELDKAMRRVGQANLQGIREEIDQYSRIRDKISGLTSILKDMNTLTPEMHRESDFSEIYTSIENRMRGVSSTALVEPPFKGLQYFDVEDAALFFGRRKLTEALLEHLRTNRFLAVVGASGSGKSSVVRAGVVVSLKDQSGWHIHIVTPTSFPLETLALALTRDSESVTAAKTFREDMRKDPESLHLYARRLMADDSKARMLLVVDQFEELFTLCRDQAEREAYVKNLMTAVSEEKQGPLTVVLTLRADFYHHSMQYQELRVALEKYQKTIGAMNQEELREAIERPAQQSGWEFEPGLVDLMLRDIGDEPGGLPLLSHALLETWERREGSTLTLRGYQAAGGVHSAIARTADRVYKSLSNDQQYIARNIFLRLIELGEGTQDTRRRAALDELVPDASRRGEVENVLSTLANARLVTTEKEGAEVAHEAIIREWPTLRDWLEENREGLRIHRHLTEAANEWERLGKDPGELYRGNRLNQTWEWIQTEVPSLNDLEREFIEASHLEESRIQAEREINQRRELEQAQKLAEERQKSTQALRQRSIYLTLGLIVAIFLSILSFALYQSSNRNFTVAESQRKLAEEQQQRAEEQTQIAQLGELSQLALQKLNQNLDLALLLSVEAYKTNNTLQTRDTLSTAWNYNPVLIKFLQNGLFDGEVAWSSQGQLASGSYDGSVIIWDLEKGEPAQRLQGHVSGGGIDSLAWSHDGRLASNSGGTIIVWDLESGKPAQTLQGRGIAWSLDGRLAYGTSDGTIIILDLENGKPIQTLKGQYSSMWDIRGLTWSADGRLASWNPHTIIIWDLESGSPSKVIQNSSSTVDSVAWSVDGRLASGTNINTIIIWDRESGQPAQTLRGHTGLVSSLAWSTDGRLASGSFDGTVIVWDIVSGEPVNILKGHTLSVHSVAWSDDGRLASGYLDSTIILWNLQSGDFIKTLQKHRASVNGVVWSDDGRLASGSSDGSVIIWDIKSGEPIQTLEGHSSAITSLAWSADGLLASGSFDGTVIVWDIANGNPNFILKGHTEGVNSVSWSPDGKLASGSSDGNVIIWDLISENPARILKGHTERVNSVAWSADGKLASGSSDGTVIIWDPISGKPAQIIKKYSGEVYSIAWSIDGRLAYSSCEEASVDGIMACLGRYIVLWNLKSGKLEQTISTHDIDISSLAWSASGQLASGSRRSPVLIWDLDSAQPAQTLWGHDAYSVAWSTDGKLASGSTDGTVTVWDLTSDLFEEPINPDNQNNPSYWTEQACQRAGRNLTKEEWSQYLSWKGPYNPEYKTCPQWE